MHWDGTISLGTLLAVITFVFLFYKASRGWSQAAKEAKDARIASENDLNWRVSNLETWRKEQMDWTKSQQVIHSALENTVSGLQSVVKMLTKNI